MINTQTNVSEKSHFVQITMYQQSQLNKQMRSMHIKWKFLFTFEQWPFKLNLLSQSMKHF